MLPLFYLGYLSVGQSDVTIIDLFSPYFKAFPRPILVERLYVPKKINKFISILKGQAGKNMIE